MANKKSVWNKVGPMGKGGPDRPAGMAPVNSAPARGPLSMRQLIAKKVAAEKLLTSKRES